MSTKSRFTPEERLAKERARYRAYDATHREERRAQAAARRKLFGPILNARTQKWREENPAKALASNQKTREKRRAQARAYRYTYYWTHRDTILANLRAQAGTPARLAKKRAYRAANLDKLRAQGRALYAKKTEHLIAGVKYRNALKRGAAGGDYSAAQWREQQELQDHRCYYCGKRRKGHLTQDHRDSVLGAACFSWQGKERLRPTSRNSPCCASSTALFRVLRRLVQRLYTVTLSPSWVYFSSVCLLFLNTGSRGSWS